MAEKSKEKPHDYKKLPIIPPDENSRDFLRKALYLIPDLEMEITTGPSIYRGKYKIDLYTSLDFLIGDFGYQVDLQNNTIGESIAVSKFVNSGIARVKEDSRVLQELKSVIAEHPDKKIVFVLVHGDIDPVSGRWKLEGETPLLYADPVIYQLSEKAEEKGYSLILMAACNPGGVKVDIEDIKIPVFATIGDNTVFGCPLEVYRPLSQNYK